MPFQLQAWDAWLFTLINQQWRCGVLDRLMPAVSFSPLLWGMSALIVFYAWRRLGLRRAACLAVLLVLCTGLTDLATGLVKDAVGRVRPLNAQAQAWYREDGHWRQRPADFKQTKSSGSSYPSGHAANSMAAALALAFCVPRVRRWIFLMPLIVGYSRLYLAKHYPTDVLAGWLLGLVVAGAVLLAAPPLYERYVLPPFARNGITKRR